MNPTFFGKRMRAVEFGYSYTLERVGLRVSAVESNGLWHCSLSLGNVATLQGTDLHPDATAAVAAFEGEIRETQTALTGITRRHAGGKSPARKRRSLPARRH